MTVLVNSSMNNATPSVRARICSRTSSGSTLPAVIRSTNATHSRRLRRVSDNAVTWAWLGQGGVNSGRAVASSSTGRCCTRSTIAVNNSSEVGSIQCKSSNNISTGCSRAGPSSWASNAASVFSLRCCGLSSGAGRSCCVRGMSSPAGRLQWPSSMASGERVSDAGAHANKPGLLDAELGRDLVGRAEADPGDIAG